VYVAKYTLFASKEGFILKELLFRLDQIARQY